MKRWRPLIWMFVSVACFIAALYFWRLGDKWQAQKPAAPVAPQNSNAPAHQAAAVPVPPEMESSSVQHSSTAPIVDVNPPATNAVMAKSTNAFLYRLSNTTQTVGELSRNPHGILLENALIDSSESTSLSIPDALRAGGDPGAYIVQSRTPIANANEFCAELAAAGATIVSFIPNNAYLVTGPSSIVGALSSIGIVMPWEPYYKVKTSLMQSTLDGFGASALNVAVFPNALADTKDALTKMGATVVSESSSPFGHQLLVRNVPSIAGVARLPGIEEVEPFLSRQPANDLTRIIMGVATNIFSPTNYLSLSGSNVSVAVVDSWIPTNTTVFNPDLPANTLIWPADIFGTGIADTDGHATHVAGIIAASGMNSPSNAVGSPDGANFEGKAPSATIWALPALDPLVSDAELQQRAAATNALISNNSWGYGDSSYDLAAASYDQAVRDSIPGATGSQSLIYVFAAGNGGNGGDNGLGGVPDSVLSPAVAKNVISVGASELPRNITNQVAVCDECATNTDACTTNTPWQGMTDSADQVARFSARGNVGVGVEGDFGRFKPDLVAPGTFVVSTRSETWDTNAYDNPVTIDTQQLINRTANTNRLFNGSVFVNCDATQLVISAISLQPLNLDLPIYARQADFPTTNTFDAVDTNVLSMPPDHALSPVDTFWNFGVLNPTNHPIRLSIFTELIRTNENGNYFQVLQSLNDALGTTNTDNAGQTFYRYESGTSMAAPAVSGTLALMEDYFTNQWKYTPSPALMKALLINGARSINSMYDFEVQNNLNIQGWGLVNLSNSLPVGITNIFSPSVSAPMFFVDQSTTNALATGQARTYNVSVDPSAQSAPLRVTLVWTDPPGNPAAGIKLVNNLDVIVTNLDSVAGATSNNPPVVFFGNTFPVGSTFSTPWNGDTNNIPSDNVNNVENIYINSPLGTNYSITVVAREVNVNAVTAHTNGIVQDYALVISSSNGEISNALTMKLDAGVLTNSYAADLTQVTNQFDTADASGGILLGQHVGANSPLQGTNSLSLTNQTDWSTNGQYMTGVSNQWHFYVITNAMGTNATETFTNAAFLTFLPVNLSIPPVGVNAPSVPDATRTEADIDLYVARGPGAFGLTNLDPTVLANATKSLSRGGTETIVFSNAQPNEVFYIGVKSEDQEAAEYAFAALFSRLPFSQMGPNGEEYLHGVNVPTPIPDGTPNLPGKARTIALAVQPIQVRRVVVTNILEHQNLGDLTGTLTHDDIPVVLNNHTFGANTTNAQQIVYEDNGEGDVPTSQHTDGPGQLTDFVGSQGLGLWLLTEEDNALFNTGRVDNVFIRLDPQLGTNGITATIHPGQFFYDFIDVPPNCTNLTINVAIIPPSTGPVQLYVRYGDLPTQTSFDYTKQITAPNGSLTITRQDLPPLRPGRYYVGIFNPTATDQTINLSWTLGLDPNGVIPTPITSTNLNTSINDDAVTNNNIFITNDQNIVEINVGVVIKHPRISDLDLTLISPEGQRFLLFENRGGTATNMGHLNVFTNFFGSFSQGVAKANTNLLAPVPNVGTLIIDYDFLQIPDRIDVYYQGQDIFSTTVSGKGTFTIPYGPGTDNTISIVMNQGNNPVSTTEWSYTPRVVTEDFTYMTFTDDTNVTDIPIKFALTPYDTNQDGTNIVLSDFELASNGQYIATPANNPTNIFDQFGGWTMTTNDFLLPTNNYRGTNLLSMATNETSVVADPTTAGGGTNFLALANGSISRTIPLNPGRDYTINYIYRGPGIAGWWRGEGDATDSSDPETLGNNGDLIGRFNFPAGEVGQAFAFEDSGLAFDFAGTNTYVQVRQSRSLDVGAGSGFTVEGWINPTNINFQQPLVEWLAPVPTNTIVHGLPVTNMVIKAGPFLNRATGHYYYLLGQTNWTTSELWANALGGHLAEVNDANEENWIYDTFAQFGGTNYTMWIGLTNASTISTNLIWSTGDNNIAYTNWGIGQPTNCSGRAIYTAILGPTNALPGLWAVLDNDGVSCTGVTNKPFGVVEVNEIQTNGVQFWISVTNSATNGPIFPGNGRLYANIIDTNSTSHEIVSPPGLIQSNVFQHVALTYNTNTGVATLYYDGTNVTSTNLGVFVPKTGGDLLIGKDMSRVTNNFFWGRMDEMSVYSRFLSPAEIAAIYRASVTTSNRNIGKFDPSISPAESLAEAQVSFGNTTNILLGNNQNWQVQGFSLRAISNTLPVQITGLEPGILLDSFNLVEKPPGNLFYFPEEPLKALVGQSAFGNWTLEIRDARTGAISTNADLVSWQLQFILQTNIAPPIVLTPQSQGTNVVPPGQIAYFLVQVPSWASFATNRIVSATAPVDLLFNQNNPPGTGAPGDFTLLNNTTAGGTTLVVNPPSAPPLVRGSSYYLGVRNNGTVPSTVVVEVDFDITTLTNGIPITSLLNTNDFERPFVFNVSSNATEATFQLLQLHGGDADLVLRKGLPLPNLLSADYGSFSGSNADETIYVLTNSLPVPLSAGPWYLDVVKRDAAASNAVRYAVLAKELDQPPAPTIINLTNRVPLNFTAGPGAALTNFFKFSVTNFPLTAVTNLGVHFEIYNQSGNGDLTVQTNALPLAPSFLQTSRLPGNNAEIIFIHTNSALTNLNADWYLGVPNNETNPISYTILAQIDTNGFPAFPTAEGAGSSTRGGALGTNVYHVTTLFDTGGPGSLRGAVTSTNSGTVVFDVSGTINLNSPLFITNSFMTIAGQTAPSNGVTIAGATTYVKDAHDVILRYLRFRPTTNTANEVVWSSSFEEGVGNTTYFAPTYFGGGWHVDSGSIDLLTNGPPFNAAPYDGNYYIDISGDSSGHISTNVTTTPGVSYTIGFAYTKDPNAASPPGVEVIVNGVIVGSVVPNYSTTFAALNWHTTSFVFTATSPLTSLAFASTTPSASGVFLDAVTLSQNGVPNAVDSLQFTNVSNIIVDHVSTEFGNNLISVLNSSNVTVQWSVLAESLNKTNVAKGGSEIRYGAGNVTLHHNLYADNYSGSPTIGEDVSLDFVNNVVFNWGVFSGFSTNDPTDNPSGLTNFLNYSANYLVAGPNSLYTNLAFWSGSSNTWIFQTNNFIDTNLDSIVDGSDTSWGMFSNQFTEFSHPFAIPATAPDESFIAYERVLDFAGNSMFQRDLLDQGIVQRARLRYADVSTNSLLSGMVAWWPAEGNSKDIVGTNNSIGGIGYTNGEVGKAFFFDGNTNYLRVPASSNLNIGATGSGITIEGWIKPDHELYPTIPTGIPIMEWDTPTVVGVDFWVEPNLRLLGDVKDTSLVDHQIETSPGAVTTNALQHVAFTYDKNTGVSFLYVNGTQVASANVGTVTPLTTGDLYLGKRIVGGAGGGVVYNGILDEMAIYNRALSQCEIAAIFNAGHGGKQALFALTNTAPTNALPYLDTDRDGIPDFWETTLNENPTNYSPNLDRDGDGYTDLEEYLNWRGVPHALTITNTQVAVDLYALSGNTGNLLFGVANGTNGTVYLTNANPCAISGPGSIAVFTPTNNFGHLTNGGYGSFTYMVTNTDTMAYFGPVTVSVFVSSVPITYASPITNTITFTNPPLTITTNEMTLLTITNGAIDSDPSQILTYTVSMTIDTNAMITRGWPLTYVSTNPSPVIDANGVITWTPSEAQGPGVYIITTVATDNSAPPVSATNNFTVIVNEVNRPPVFDGTPPDQTNFALVPITVTNAATDPDIPPNPLTYILLNPPAGASIDNNGIITWTPTLAQAPGVYTITTVVSDTNAYALFNNVLSATNSFTITVPPLAAPFAFTQPAQAVTGTSAKLNGMATPNGLPAMAWFEWGTNTTYGNQTTPIALGNSPNVIYITNVLTGLLPHVPYHYRLVVSNLFAVTFGFDQILDEANVVAWGADYVKQAEVPPGLSNVVAIAGAYDHSLALKNNETVVAWGDNTFSQTNVPPGLNNILAVAGGQYSSIALRNNGSVAAWGGNILSVTNVPPGLNNVIMIAGGTYASLALQSSGNIVAWGANFFGVTNIPPGLNNVVEVAGGSYHSLAIRNDGTVVAWGDNSANQTNVPPTATNVVAIAGGNYHSLALRADGTVVAWGDDSAGQTNVPPGLSNVVAVAAGGFHSLALKNDGTVIAWGDDTAGQSSVPVGLSNVVAISSGYFHSLALTPTLLSTNPIILDLTNAEPRTNSILSGSTIFYRVDVPTNVDFATNSLLFSVNGLLNVWFTTNTPPTITSSNDFLLFTNTASGTSAISSATSPQLIPGTTYYLGVQNTNGFTTAYAIEVDFHFLTNAPPPPTNGPPISTITQTNINGTNGFLLVWFAPTNDLFQVQWRDGLSGPWGTFTNIVSYHTFISPTNSEFEFFDDGTQTGGLSPFRFYRLILLNPGSTNPPPPPPITNAPPISTITQTNINGTNAFLLVWFAPTNDLFQVQWRNGLTGSWSTFTNIVSFHTFISPTNSEFEFLDDNSQTGGPSSLRFYRLILLNPGSTNPPPPPPSTNSVPISTVTETNNNGTNVFTLQWFAPTNDLFQVQWRNGLTGPWSTFTNIISYHTFISPTNSEFEFTDDGTQTGGNSASRFYRLILLNPGSPGSPSVTPLANGVPLNFTTTVGATNYFSFNITQTNASVLFELYNLSGNGDLLAQVSNLPTAPPYFRSSTNPGTNFEQIVIRTNASVPSLNAISWFLGVPNQSTGSINYTIRAVVTTNGILPSGMPLNVAATPSGGSNVQISWGPTVDGETYQVQTNGNLFSPSWGVLTTIVVNGVSQETFTDTVSGAHPLLFYRVVQVP